MDSSLASVQLTTRQERFSEDNFENMMIDEFNVDAHLRQADGMVGFRVLPQKLRDVLHEVRMFGVRLC